LEIMNWQQTSDKEIPKYKVGDIVELKAIRITEGKVRFIIISTHHPLYIDSSPRFPDRSPVDFTDGKEWNRDRRLYPDAH
jgi:hypothetical protein